jgi:hypothetical protein
MLTLCIPFSNHINILNAPSHYSSDSSICLMVVIIVLLVRNITVVTILQAVRSLMQMCLQGYGIEKVQ